MQVYRFIFRVSMILFLLVYSLGASSSSSHPGSVRFLSLADIHFDPFITCQYQGPCPLIETLRRAPASQWASILAKEDKELPRYRQDSNHLLLESALAAAKKTAEREQAQFVLILGDFLGHHFKSYYRRYAADPSRQGYQSFVNKTFAYLIGEIKKNFPDMNVYAALGNNDSYYSDYVTHLQGPFFNDIAILFSSLVHNKNIQGEMQKQIARAGYYAIDLPQQPNLRLIVLNTNLFSVKAKGKGLERAAFQELNWLHQELVSVKNRQQKALIAMHIPQGINLYTSLSVRLFTLLALWHPAYNKRFDAELKAFASEISGIFTAHLHSDSVEILNYGEGRKIPVLGTPSISPLFGNHPGFKIYSYLAATLEMEEYFTYFYPLNTRRAWGLEYDLNRIYQPNCYSCPISEGLTPYGDGVFAITFKDQLDAAAKWYVYYGCAIWQLSPKNYEFCKQL